MGILIAALVLLFLLLATSIYYLTYRPIPLHFLFHHPIPLLFGHAFPSLDPAAVGDPVGEACSLLKNTDTLKPRDPTAKSVVWAAEGLLGIAPGKRPVYAYIGDLHPALGHIGVIISHTWFWREAQGVSRCDSGGLIGCMGGFNCLSPDEAAQALTALSHGPNDKWEQFFCTEIATAFRFWDVWKRYLRGHVPTLSPRRDVRARCIEAVLAGGGAPDRRLWTWEARSYSEVTVADVNTVVFAPEAFKDFDSRFAGTTLPSHVNILCGSVSSSGVHYFEEEQVFNAFMGRVK